MPSISQVELKLMILGRFLASYSPYVPFTMFLLCQPWFMKLGPPVSTYYTQPSIIPVAKRSHDDVSSKDMQAVLLFLFVFQQIPNLS
jgi:hypothetical protein